MSRKYAPFSHNCQFSIDLSISKGWAKGPWDGERGQGACGMWHGASKLASIKANKANAKTLKPFLACNTNTKSY